MTNPTSLIPPRTLTKIASLIGSDRGVYVQELIASYELKVAEYEKVLEVVYDSYVVKQKEHFESVLAELVELMDNFQYITLLETPEGKMSWSLS